MGEERTLDNVMLTTDTLEMCTATRCVPEETKF
jgi:hypothetical protein